MGKHTELIFVDGNSTDGTEEEIKRHRHLWIGENGRVNIQFYDADGDPIDRDEFSESLREPLHLDHRGRTSPGCSAPMRVGNGAIR